MNLSRASIALYMGLVFASGAVLGVFGNRYYVAKVAPPPAKGKGAPFGSDEWRRLYLSGLKKHLNLTDDQVSRISAVMDETKRLMDDLHKRQLPEQMELSKGQGQKIREILNDDQRAKYEDMLARMRNPKNKQKADSNQPQPLK
jgi:Spy/CpxP family protein refolding chaperone